MANEADGLDLGSTNELRGRDLRQTPARAAAPAPACGAQRARARGRYVVALVSTLAVFVGGVAVGAPLHFAEIRRSGRTLASISSGLAQESNGIAGSGSNIASKVETATAGLQLTKPAVGMAGTASGHGFWLVTSDGDVSSFGDARFFGSAGTMTVNLHIVGIAATPSGGGYWLVASDGVIFSFGDARFFGPASGLRLNRPIVGMAVTPSGGGYWLAGADGAIFTFGDAHFFGSSAAPAAPGSTGSTGSTAPVPAPAPAATAATATAAGSTAGSTAAATAPAAATPGATALRQPITGMAATPSGAGYWLAAADGEVFSFGDATFQGSSVGQSVAPVVGVASTTTGHGYWLAAADGSVYSFGDATAGTSAAALLSEPIAGMTGSRAGGYWLVGVNGAIISMAAPAIATPTAQPDPGGNPGSYTFLASNNDGTPIRYDPCRPVHYVTNLASAPPSAGADIVGALARVSAATGISFVNDGPTTELPARTRPSYQPARYGQRWAPVLIAWASPATTDLLPGGTIVGEGGSSWVQQGSAPAVFVTGQVGVDKGATAGLAAGFGVGTSIGELLLHELGHVVGLGHTSDNSQIMYSDLQTRPSADYSAGDQTGLHRVGIASGCLTVPSAH